MAKTKQSTKKNKDLIWVFDLDGTLFQSHHQIIKAVNRTRQAFGLEALSEIEAFKKIGLPAKEFFIDMPMSTNSLDALVSEFRSRLTIDLSAGTPLYPGAQKLLERLNSLGYGIGIATMKPDDLAEQMVKISPLNGLVRHVQGSTGINPKPSADVLNKVMQKFGSKNLILVGDRFEDVDCAKNANVMSIGVGQTVVSASDLKKRGAFASFDSLLQLSENLDSLLDHLSLELKCS